MREKIAIIGGDMRQTMLASLMSADGFDTGVYAVGENEEYICPHKLSGLDELSGYEAVVLPMPVLKDGGALNAPMYSGEIMPDEVMRHISPNAVVLGGKLPHDMVEKYKRLSFYDYLEREDFAVKNSVATAEGAIALAVNETPFTIWQSRCLVIGYGRIGRALTRLLRAMGANVDAAARRCADRAVIETVGCGALDTAQLDKYIGNYDLIFNTVPARLISPSVLAAVKRGALTVDLASKPGGVDLEAARSMGRNVIWALSIPGKTAPLTSGRILKDTIINILKELDRPA